MTNSWKMCLDLDAACCPIYSWIDSNDEPDRPIKDILDTLRDEVNHA